MSDSSLTYLKFENGETVQCEHPDDALAKIREMSEFEGKVTMTQQSMPSGFSQTLEYDPVSDDWMPPSNKGAE